MGRSGAGATRSATRDDVARLAGVSTAVVSYVVNDGPRPVAAATRERVLDAIERLGYRPNAAARSLITGRSGLIGLVVPDLENQYFAALAKALERAGSARGQRLVLAQADTPDFADLLASLAGHRLDGLVTASLPTLRALAEAGAAQLRVVRISQAPGLEGVPTLTPDYYTGAVAAVAHLVEVHGHRRIALVTGGDPGEPREHGWRDALDERGLSARSVVRVEWSPAGGREAATVLTEKHPEVSAVFVASDQQAVGVLAGLHALGRGVPTDLAVASFDGSAASAFTIPPLTTAQVPLDQMADDAMDELLGEPLVDRVYPTTLVVRESCGCPPAA